MRRLIAVCALLASNCGRTGLRRCCVSGARAKAGPSVTRPKDVIVARQELMEHIEELMEPIDTLEVKDTNDLGTLSS